MLDIITVGLDLAASISIFGPAKFSESRNMHTDEGGQPIYRVGKITTKRKLNRLMPVGFLLE